ncbi:MAG: hypothetical protein K6F88_02245, partial [Ruminococcus sp.]|nr:hypothetical protein [Ruminococcus sp.]
NVQQVAQADTVVPALVDKTFAKDENDPLKNASNLSYKGARFLGYQSRAFLTEATQPNSLRFFTEVSSEILNVLNNDASADYGYLFMLVKSDGSADYNNLTVNNTKAHKYSCKGTTNTVAGDFGNANYNATDYKYVTAAVNDIPENVKYVARFYIVYNGTTYVQYGDGDETGVVFNTPVQA